MPFPISGRARRLLALAGVVVALGLLAAWLAAARVPSVPAVNVQNAPLVRTLQFSGRVETASRVEVGATITGRVAEVKVAEGARVRAGALLATLEADEWRAALSQAEAAQRQAEAALSGLRGSGRLAVAAGVAQADAQVAAAQADFRRTQELVERGFLGQARLDESRRALEVAQAQQAAAQAQRSANADSGAEIRQAQAQLALAQAAAQLARARLAQTELRAPADAQVLLRSVEPGQIVQPGRALLTLALAGPLQLVAPVDERFLDQLRVGQSAAVLADALPGRRFSARIERIAPRVDAQRGSVELTLVPLPPLPDGLREDMTLSLEIETGRRDRALVLPLGALRPPMDDTAATVQVVVDGRVQARRVALGLRTLEAVEVRDGLAEGDTVLVGNGPAPGERVQADLAAPARSSAAAGSAGAALSNAMGR